MYKIPREIPGFSYIRTVNIICVEKILSNIQNVCVISLYFKLSYLLSVLPILMELSAPCNGRNIRWFLKVSNKQLNQKRFCYQIIGLFQSSSTCAGLASIVRTKIVSRCLFKFSMKPILANWALFSLNRG